MTEGMCEVVAEETSVLLMAEGMDELMAEGMGE